MFLAVAIFLAQTVVACSIVTDSFVVETRADGDYFNLLTAPKNTDIDIQIISRVASYSGNDCPPNISAGAKIYRYNEDSRTWELLKTSLIKSQELAADFFTFRWSNEFNTGASERYKQYKIVGSIMRGNTELDTGEAFVLVVDNACSGIAINVPDISIDEAKTTIRTLNVVNNTSLEFRINSSNLYIASSGLLRNATIDSGIIVPPRGTRSISMRLDSEAVSQTTSSIARVGISGNLGDTYCRESDIGLKSFNITVNNTASNNVYGEYYDGYYTDYSSASTECKLVEIEQKNVVVEENLNSKVTFSIRNNSTKRFEIIESRTTTNGAQVKIFSRDQYIFPGQIGDVVLDIDAPNVTTESTFENIFKLRGKFSDGRVCSFTDIGERKYTLTVLNSTASLSNFCGELSINTSSEVNIENFGSFPFTIKNMTDKRADIFVEGTVEAEPTMISLPPHTSISRDLIVRTTQASGEVIFRPVVEGCGYPSQRVLIINNARGRISSLKMSVEKRVDENRGIVELSIGVKNPTTKIFEGMIQVVGSNENILAKRLARLVPGENLIQVGVQMNSNPSKVLFTSEEETVFVELEKTDGVGFLGFFTMSGMEQTAIGLLVVLIVIVILIALVVEKGVPISKETEQPWVRK